MHNILSYLGLPVGVVAGGLLDSNGIEAIASSFDRHPAFFAAVAVGYGANLWARIQRDKKVKPQTPLESFEAVVKMVGGDEKRLAVLLGVGKKKVKSGEQEDSE